jgi:[ribosomal protein S18]-alanine N-acetyltransferase
MTLNPVSLRRFRPADLAEVTRIERACFRSDAYPAELFLAYFEQQPALFLVAESAGEVVAYVLGEIRRGVAEVVSLAVTPRHRRGGVAGALLQSLFRRVRARGIPTVTLMVKVTNVRAIRLYLKLGFAHQRRVRAYYEDGSDGWRMTRALMGRQRKV